MGSNTLRMVSPLFKQSLAFLVPCLFHTGHTQYLVEQGNQGIDQGNNFVPYFLPIGFGQYFWPNTDIVPRFAVNFEDDPADQNWATEIMKPQKSPLVPENFPNEEKISTDQYQQQPVPKKKAGFSDVLMGLLNRLVEGHIQLSFS